MPYCTRLIHGRECTFNDGQQVLSVVVVGVSVALGLLLKHKLDHDRPKSYAYICVPGPLAPSPPAEKPTSLPKGYFKCSETLELAKCFAPMPSLPPPIGFNTDANATSGLKATSTEHSYHSCIQCAEAHGNLFNGCQRQYYPHICGSSAAGANVSSWGNCMKNVKQNCSSQATSPASCEKCAVANEMKLAQFNCTADVMYHACSASAPRGPGTCKQVLSWEVQKNSQESVFVGEAQCKQMCQ